MQHLRFSRARITEQQYIDIPPDPMLGVYVLGTTTEEAEGDGSLDVLVAVYRRRYGAYDSTPDLLAMEEEKANGLEVNVTKSPKINKKLLVYTHEDTNCTRVIQ